MTKFVYDHKMGHHGVGLMGLAIVLTMSLVVGTTGDPVPAIPFYCRLNEIQCPSNITKCIKVLGLCNGVKDCPDGSDENLAFCKGYSCDKLDRRLNYDGEQSRFFFSSKCLSGNMCTKDFIFPWRPDEEDAGTFFWCTGGPKQCADGSDESPKYCKNLQCETLDVNFNKAVTCPSKNFCLIPKCDHCGREHALDLLCNGQKDCPDGSDEWPSFCKTNGCSYLSDPNFRCTDGGCVQTDQICNGVKDCKDGSDESPSFCKTYTCPQNAGRKCPGTNICLPDSAVCDGKKTCPDGSDEKASFCKAYTPPAGFFKCKDGLQTVGKLVNVGGRKELVDARCDNVYDCKDKSDEAASLCKTFKCPEYKVKCPGNGACIYNSYICDGKVDCLDKSDEKVSVCTKFTCPSDLIKCKKTGTCVEGNYCDGYVDCADKTDEDPTFCRNFSCPAGTAKCPNFPFQCITAALLCDGKKDCINGGDEDPTVCNP